MIRPKVNDNCPESTILFPFGATSPSSLSLDYCFVHTKIWILITRLLVWALVSLWRAQAIEDMGVDGLSGSETNQEVRIGPTVRSGRAADAVIAKLEEQIATGVLENNAPLPAERQLMEQFNASRTVIREAIAALSSRGLIESKPRFRPVVRKPDYATALTAVGGVVRHLMSEKGGVKNLYDSRVFLERALVRQAAMSAKKDHIEQLREALAANGQAIDSSDLFDATDVAFHGVLYTIPKNPIFPAIHKGYTSWLSPHWERMLRSPERNLVNYRSHQAIFDAILDRDPDTAEEALVNHLASAWEYVRATFEPDGS